MQDPAPIDALEDELVAVAEGHRVVPTRWLHELLAAHQPPRIRSTAAFALSKVGSRRSLVHLRQALASAPARQSHLRRQILIALCDRGGPAALAPLMGELGRWPAADRALVLDFLGAWGGPSALRALAAAGPLPLPPAAQRAHRRAVESAARPRRKAGAAR
jgi:hypothetical protein